ncbi:MAG TPA: FkbM family methyltransferase [Xanthobacteraceae bacterium]|nr:FkbM family methyltransferase [Xanthobacteraceae bacterium]
MGWTAIWHDQEPQLVREFFGSARNGYFVEVGANDPHELSQTWHLETLGWTGVLIEPQPALAARLARARVASVFAAACTSPQNAGRTMPFYVAGPHSALDRDRMTHGATPEQVIEVPTRTLDSILEEADAPSPIDFLSVDVEGHELEVLRGFNFARWRPRLIVVEDHVEGLAKHWFIQSHGYRLIRRVGHNGWYVPDESDVRATWDERCRIVRKYYLALPFRMGRNGLRRVRQRFNGLRRVRQRLWNARR